MADVSAADVAEHIGVSAKAFRRFVREYKKGLGGIVGVDTPGRGGRYVFDDGELDVIADAYRAWASRSGSMRITFGEAPEDV